jgi:toxin CptA
MKKGRHGEGENFIFELSLSPCLLVSLSPRLRVSTSPCFKVTLALALILVLALPLLWFSLVTAPAIRVEVGMPGDDTYLSGFNEPEKNATATFRWTGVAAGMRLPNLSSRYQELRIHAHGWRPAGMESPIVQLDLAGRPWTSMQTQRDLRIYHVLLPRDATSPTIDIGFTTPVYSTPNDDRELGFGLDWLELHELDRTAGPTFRQFGGQALLLILALLLLALLALPWGWAIAAALLLAITLIGANLRQPLWVSAALGGWLIAVGLLVAATLLLAPWLKHRLMPWMSPQQTSVAWALLAGALALRLLGATHPLFTIHDIGFHHIWLDAATQGNLYIFSAPSEFQNRPTFNPPIGYVLMMPLQLLLPNERLAIQAGLALGDALGCLFLLLLARELGLSARAGLLALAIYLALPINMTILWWGFATNALAQTAGLALLWALLRLAQQRRQDATYWFSTVIFVAIGVISLLMHVGALVLIVALLGTCLLLGWPRLAPHARTAIVGALLLAGAITMLFYLSAVIDPLLGQPAGAAIPSSVSVPPPSLGDAFARSWAARATKLGLVGQGLVLGFLALPLALAPLGLAQLLRQRPPSPLGRPLIVAWLLVCLLFMGVYFGLGLLVRYIYFATPLICLALGVLMNRLWRRGGRPVILALVLFVVASGAALWVAGVLLGVKPSLLPLTQ